MVRRINRLKWPVLIGAAGELWCGLQLLYSRYPIINARVKETAPKTNAQRISPHRFRELPPTATPSC